MARAFSRALFNAGSSIPARMAMIAITTNSSMRVKFFFCIFTIPFFLGYCQENNLYYFFYEKYFKSSMPPTGLQLFGVSGFVALETICFNTENSYSEKKYIPFFSGCNDFK
jgi:hypothetical protein